MAIRRGFSRGGVKPPQRQIANFATCGEVTLTFGASLRATALGTVALNTIVAAATLVRSRGLIEMALTASGSNNNTVAGVMGIIQVSVEAFTAGLASLPTPITDPARPWIVWQPFGLFADGAALGEAAQGRSEFQLFDSRGMRKLKANDTLAVVFEACQFDATTGTVVHGTYVWRDQLKL